MKLTEDQIKLIRDKTVDIYAAGDYRNAIMKQELPDSVKDALIFFYNHFCKHGASPQYATMKDLQEAFDKHKETITALGLLEVDKGDKSEIPGAILLPMPEQHETMLEAMKLMRRIMKE